MNFNQRWAERECHLLWSNKEKLTTTHQALHCQTPVRVPSNQFLTSDPFSNPSSALSTSIYCSSKLVKINKDYFMQDKKYLLVIGPQLVLPEIKGEEAPTLITSQCIWLLVLSVHSGKGQLLLPVFCSPFPLYPGMALGFCWISNRSSEGDKRHAGMMRRARSTVGSHRCSLTAGAGFQQRLFTPNCCAKSCYLLDHSHHLESHKSEGLIANSAGSQILSCVSQFKFN